MPDYPWISNEELSQILTNAVQREVADLLKVSRPERRDKLAEKVKWAARGYDAALISLDRQPKRGKTASSLRRIRARASALGRSIAEADPRAHWEVAHALSVTRGLLQQASGTPLLPYGHKASNQLMFDRESLHILLEELSNIDKHLATELPKLNKPGPMPGPEMDAVQGLMEVWMEFAPRERGKPTEPTHGQLLKLTELILAPVAARREKTPSFDSFVRDVLYVGDPAPKG